EVAEGVHEAEDREVRLQVRGEGSGALMLGDTVRLRTALDAIFRAILREQPTACTVVAERRLERRAGQPASAVLVVAPDTRVAEAYGQERAAFDEKRGGLGLALPIARRIIEHHGGRVWAPAQALERGSAIVSLPLAE